MVRHRKILAAVGSDDKDLKGVHYALAAADRMQAEVYILGHERPGPEGTGSERDNGWREKALLDLINSARQAGLTVSYHTATGPLGAEVLRLVREEGIDLVVLAEGDRQLKNSLLQSRSVLAGQVIQVKGKDRVDYL